MDGIAVSQEHPSWAVKIQSGERVYVLGSQHRR
jgi:hypothetical protein